MNTLIQKVLEEETQKVKHIVNCMKNEFHHKKKKIEGTVGEIKNTEHLIQQVNEQKHISLKSFQKEDEQAFKEFFQFNFDQTQRFVLFYTSSIYSGELMFATDESFLSQLNDKLSSIDVKVEGIVTVQPTYKKEDNILFKCTHPEMEHVYFSIVKFSPDGYKFYFMYDVFGKVFSFDPDALYAKIELINNDFDKYQEYFNPENIKKATLLYALQKKILSFKQNDKKRVQKYDALFSYIDVMRNQLELQEHIFDKENVQKIEEVVKDLELEEKGLIESMKKLLESLHIYEREKINYAHQKQTMQKEIGLFKEKMQISKSTGEYNILEKELSVKQDMMQNLSASLDNTLLLQQSLIQQHKEHVLKLLIALYKKADEAYIQYKIEAADMLQELKESYQSYFNLLKKDEVNYIHLFKEIESLYSLETCQSDAFPMVLRDFFEETDHTLSEIKKILRMETYYDGLVDEAFEKIVRTTDELIEGSSISQAIIHAIEKKFIEEMRVIY